MIAMGVSKVVYSGADGETTLIDLTSDTVKPEKLAAGITAHDAAGNKITGILEIVSPKVHLDQGTMYAPATSAYYRVQTVSDTSVNFNYYGGSGCEQIVYPITGLAPGCTYTISFSETYNGGFIGESYLYGCGIMQESEYNATSFPVNAGKPSFVTWNTRSTGTQSGSHTFTAQTTKAYWVWSMACCADSVVHNITFNVKAQANGVTLQNKTVTENGTVIADDGYDGLGTVTVNVPSEEANLQTVKSVNITANGTHTIIPDGGYDGMISAEVIVNVANDEGGDAGKEDELITRSLKSYSNDRIATVGDYAFYSYDSLQSVNLPRVTKVGNMSFYGCQTLTSFYAPYVLNIGTNTFNNCSRLKTLDFLGLQSIGNLSFAYTSSLTAFILRGAIVCTLGSASEFYGSAIKTKGYIYVQAVLIDTYKNATNWSALADRFRALEDYTVDGTVTGALDESKI